MYLCLYVDTCMYTQVMYIYTCPSRHLKELTVTVKFMAVDY